MEDQPSFCKVYQLLTTANHYVAAIEFVPTKSLYSVYFSLSKFQVKTVVLAIAAAIKEMNEKTLRIAT